METCQRSDGRDLEFSRQYFLRKTEITGETFKEKIKVYSIQKELL